MRTLDFTQVKALKISVLVYCCIFNGKLYWKLSIIEYIFSWYCAFNSCCFFHNKLSIVPTYALLVFIWVDLIEHVLHFFFKISPIFRCTINTNKPFIVSHYQNNQAANIWMSQEGRTADFNFCSDAGYAAKMAESYGGMVFSASLWGNYF